MGRPSNRVAVLEAAIRVAEEQGLAAVTIDSVAAAAGMTKGGLLYHFPNRQALLLAVYTHLAQAWEAEMRAALGAVPPEEASAQEKLRAYVRVATRSMTRAELLLLADAGSNTELLEPWAHVAAQWAPTLPTPDADGEYPERLVHELVARMAADGLWSYETLTGIEVPAALRARIAEHIITLLDHP